MKNIVSLRYIWFLISLLIIVPGAIYFAMYGLRTGIDFAGGALWDLHFTTKQTSDLNTEKIGEIFAANGFEGAQVQVSTIKVNGKEMLVLKEEELIAVVE